MIKTKLTAVQREILDAVRRLTPNAYGLTIYDALLGGYSFGKIYVALDELEAKGLVVSEHKGATPERGYREKRFVSLTDAGTEALKA